jgi:hypothetical protein
MVSNPLNTSSISFVSQQMDLFIKQNPWALPVLIAIQIWKLAWYAVAIYQAAFVRKQKAWFIVLLVCAFFLNDLGLLAIFYLIVNRDKKEVKKPEKKKNSRKK